MYLSRVRLNRAAIKPARLSRLFGGGGYRLHQALWNLFESDTDAGRDFLYRQEREEEGPSFLLLSRRWPRDSEDIWSIETKPFAPQLGAGDRLAFSVRINPVVSRKDEEGRQHRHDLVMDLKHRARDSGEQFRQVGLVQQAGEQWLSTRASDAGFSLDESGLLAEGYRQHRLTRRGGGPIQFSTIDCNGQLQVVDPDTFLSTVCGGLGPAKAFGCGLLLIRRI